MKFEDLDIRATLDVKPQKYDIDVLKLKLKLNEMKRRAERYKTLAPNDASLFAAIDLCLDAPKHLKGEFDKLDKAIARIKKYAPTDRKTKIRVDYLEYEKWALKATITDYFNEAARRKERLFELLDSEEKQKEEMAKCEESFDYWFDNYAWIVDPRNPILFAFPFQRYEFQKEATEWIFDLIFVLRSHGLIDKSRDMGVTWLVVCIFIYCWLFPRGGSQFHALITSYREDEVDKSGVPGTIFEKVRSQLRLLPSWMLPEGFKMGGKGKESHVSHMRVVNPQNGSTIVGTTANAETGRSGRYTVVFFDESASIEHDESSAAAASQSTKTCLFVSTPKGKLNYFAKKRFSGDIPVLSFHWMKHPYKDKRWYNGQKLQLSPEMIAQELDIDYDASQPGKVYPSYDETYHVITKSEFMREIEGAIAVEQDGKRRFRIPLEWQLGRAHDWGSSDSNGEHANITMWFATAKRGTLTKTHKIDIGGSVFIYRMLTAPPHSTVRSVARNVHILQAPDREQQRMATEVMSHEALSELDTYSQEHDLHYTQWNTDYNAGIAQVRDYLEVQYTHQPHPFRLNLEKSAPTLMGRPMIYIIVDDDQGECYFDYMTQKWQVRPGKDDSGLARLRAEFGVYHYPKSEAGKAVKKQRPEKLFDDCMDCLRCMAVTFPPVASYTIAEQLELELPESLRAEKGRQETDPEEKARLWLARQSYIVQNKLLEKAKQQPATSRREAIYRQAREKAGRR